MPPKEPAPWSDVRDATLFGNRAPQTDATGFMEEEVVALDRTAQSEDCLRPEYLDRRPWRRKEAPGDAVVPWRRLHRRIGRQCPL